MKRSHAVAVPELPVQTLDEWLEAIARRPLVLVGATGHLELTAEEEANIARRLSGTVLPELFAAAPEGDIVVVNGLAPGADLIVAETIATWLAQQGRSCRQVGILPVPSEVLWEDWRRRVRGADSEHLAAMRTRFDANLRACDSLVLLWDGDAPPDWSDRALRERHYRRLAACLVEQCDILVAVLRPGRARAPGGTSEVVAWRSEGVPHVFSTGPRRHRSAWSGDDRLVVLDPAAASPAEDARLDARSALRAGNYLLCYDLVSKAQQQGQADDELQYLKILALANAGSTEAALRQFGELSGTLRRQNEDWLALEGRLHKDLALRGGFGAVVHFRSAAQAYQAAFKRTDGYFSAINAATTTLLAGDVKGARRLAQAVLDRVEPLAPADETERYYRNATEAEAALLLGDLARASPALRAADALLPNNVNARSRTRQQLRLVCRALALDESVVDLLRIPPVLYVPPAAVHDDVTEVTAPPFAFAYAGLAGPAEVRIAESLLQQRSRLYVVLAMSRERMRAQWRAQHGPEWAGRLEQVLARAEDISTARGFLDEEEDWSDGHVGAMALGLSRLTARRLGCAWRALGARGEWIEGDPAPAARDLRATGAVPTFEPPRYARRFAGIIFADFAGFSGLADEDLPRFWGEFMRPIGEQLAARRDDVLLKHTWGDAVHVVTANAASAAAIACEIQDRLDEMRPSLSGELQRLELRLSAHYAPVFSGPDPVEEQVTYFGTQLSFTARIEPVTPPGMIFVTEAFAAQLAIEAPALFVLEYAGEVQLAKSYGKSRLFSLRRATS